MFDAINKVSRDRSLMYVLGIISSWCAGWLIGASIPVQTPFLFAVGIMVLYISTYSLIRAAIRRDND